jgi:ABC-type branched-subunit amino acid transport system substrate-binding protein
MARRTHAQLITGAAVTAVLVACSSAPAPITLGQTDGTTGSVTTGGAPVPGTTGTTGTTGSTLAGTTGGTIPGATGGATSGTTGAGGTATGATSGTTGPGTTGATGGTPGGPMAPAGQTQLFTPAEDTIGITKNSIHLCAHAALTYGKAFNTDVKDLGVFWTALNAEKGGIFGRKVDLSFYDDAYDPVKAQAAAVQCIDTKPFLMEGGIGFDQIPAVRNVAEQKHTLYLYHTATVKGSAGLKYSFTELPTVERVGEGFAQLALQKYKGKRIGIIKRDSVNWEPGVTAFKKMAKAKGLDVVVEQAEKASAGNYSNSIAAMKNAKADVVWVWLNALESSEVIQQMKGQNYSPNVMVFPFNLTTQTLAVNSMNPPLDGVAMYPAYSYQDYSGPFASYADDMKEFERQYAQYDSSANLRGAGGDLLFLNWVGQKALAVQLQLCGPNCTRNKFVEVLQGYHAAPSSSACKIDFTQGDHHHGSDQLVFMTPYLSPSGVYNWRATQKCVQP